MKKLITLALIISATTFTQAQSNLVFNQVLNFNIGVGETVTVPDGKAWKLESGVSQGDVLISSTNQEYGNNLDSSNMDDYAIQTYQLPLWLGQGTSLTYNGSSGNNYLSILEFNVVAISSSSGGSGGDSGGGDSGSGISNGSLPGDDYTDGEPITDNDGNSYETVVIEGQTWTTTNLNVSTYRDGTPIPYISDWDEWANATTGAYTYAGQDSEAGYGKLYNLLAIIGRHDNDGATIDKILAPEGYHIPSDLEWKSLLDIYIVGVPWSFTNANGYNADVASVYFKSQTSWDNNGYNESGLNVKNYPIIYSGQAQTNSTSSNFYEVGDTDTGTRFGTKTLASYSQTYASLLGVRFGEFEMETTPVIHHLNSANSLSNSGVYIRLIKD